MYAAGATQGAGYIDAAGDAETATSMLTLSGGTLAVVSNTRTNGRATTCGLSCSARGLGGCRPRRCDCRCAPPTRRSPSPPAPRPSWTGSPRRSAPSCRFTEVGPAP